MKKILKIFTLVSAFYLVGGFLVKRQQIPLPFLPNSNAARVLQAKGSIHFHSIYSDGSGTLQEIAQAAAENDLDFLILTDHGQQAQYEITQKFYTVGKKSILFLAYAEVGSEFGHYLQIEDLQILAHPFHPIVPWKDFNHLMHFSGLEIYSGSKVLQGEMFKVFSFVKALVFYPFNPDYSFLTLCRIPWQELNLWDKMNQVKPTLGIVSTDAHAKIILEKNRNWYLAFPSYVSAFKSFQNHFILDSPLDPADFNGSKKLILDALRQGQFYGALDSLLASDGFNFYAKNADGQIFKMGSKTNYQNGMRLQAHLGARVPKTSYKIRLLKDGTQVSFTRQAQLNFAVSQPGNYRIEVYVDMPKAFGGKQTILWIISNPIRIE